MSRRALQALLPLALLLIPVPGSATAATCTARTSGFWNANSTWNCNAKPKASDAVVIPAGRVVTLADGDTGVAAGLTLLGGTLALGHGGELDTTGLAVSGGATISGTLSEDASAQITVTLPLGAQAAIDSSGLTVSGVYLVVDGQGTFAIAGPIAAREGGWIESGVDTTWTGTAPWLLGGDSGTFSSGFTMQDARLTIDGPIAAQSADGGGEIQLNGTATLYKQDATTAALDVVVSLDSLAEVHVLAGKLVGSFRGIGALYVAAGATLGLDGSALQLAPAAMGLTGASLEIEPNADLTLILPGEPALLSLGIGTGAALDVSTGDAVGPVEGDSPPDMLAQVLAIGASGTLSIGGGAGTLGLADHHVLTGSGTLDASLDNSAGTLSPTGVMHLTGDYAQGAGGTLALGLRSTSDGDSLQVDGTVGLAGTLRVSTSYAPVPTAAPLVLAAPAKPEGAFGTTDAPLSSGHAWKPAYSASGVTLGAGADAGRDAPTSLKKPALRPAIPVVGGRTRCLPGKWSGAHKLAFRWLRSGKPIAKATAARYLVRAADLGHKLACRVTATATATGGAHAEATTKGARARLGLQIDRVVAGGGGVSVVLRCAAGERRCAGSLSVLVAGRAIAAGRFAVRSPGGVVQVKRFAAARGPATGIAVVRVSYRNGAGQARDMLRRLRLAG